MDDVFELIDHRLHIGENAALTLNTDQRPNGIQVTLFKLMKTFERLMVKIRQRQNKPVHTVVQYRYTMEESRENMLSLVQREKTLAFEKIFEACETRLHAIFMFLSMLELVQNNYMSILIGEGRNNFIIEFNEDRPADEDPYDFNADRSGRDLTRFNEKDEDAGPLFRKDPDAGLRVDDAGLRMDDASLRIDDAGLRIDDAGLHIDDASLRMDDAGLRFDEDGSEGDDGSGDDDPGFGPGPDEDKSLLN